MTAEVDHGGFECDERAQQVKRLDRPSGLEPEAFPMTHAFELGLDRMRFAIQRKAIDSARARGQEQDRTLLPRAIQLQTLDGSQRERVCRPLQDADRAAA